MTKSTEHPATGPAPSVEARDGPEGTRLGTVVAFVPCAPCGYDLRGLPADGRCPECGREIRCSLSPDRLMFADGAWLADLKRALALLGLAWRRWWLLYLAWVLVLIGAFVVTVTFVSLVPGLPPQGFAGVWLSPMRDLVPALIMLPLVPFGVYGGWLLTRREPGGAPVAPGPLPPRPPLPGWRAFLFGDARRAVGALPVLVLWLGAWLAAWCERVLREPARILARALVLGAAGVVVLLAGWPLITGRSPAVLFLTLILVPIGAICSYVGTILERIPDRRLARRAFAGALAAGAGMVVVALLPRGLWRTFVGSSVSLIVLLASGTLSMYAAAVGAKAIGRVLEHAIPLERAVSGPGEPPARPV